MSLNLWRRWRVPKARREEPDVAVEALLRLLTKVAIVQVMPIGRFILNIGHPL